MRHLLSRLLVLGAVTLTACSPAAPATTPTNPSTGGSTAPVEQKADTQNLKVLAAGLIGNPTPQSSSSNAYQFFPMYDSMTKFGENSSVIPWVATKWEAAADGLAWNFTIRSDMTFSNGDKLTAEDVAFSVQTVIDKKWPQLANIATVTKATATSPTTVQLTTKQIDVTIPSGTTYIWIIPKAYYERVGFDAFLLKPIGSGPYELTEFRNADQIFYKKRSAPHAFRKALPDQITIRALPDGGQQVNGLRTGEADIVAAASYQAEQADAMRKEGIQIVNKPTGIGAVRFTQSVYEAKKSPLTNIKVRQALNYAVDKVTLTKTLYKDYGKPDGQFALPGSQYHDPSVQPWPYDVAKAKALLAEAGYPNGFKMTMDYSPAMSSPTLIQAIQGYFKDVGVDLTLSSYELGVYVDKVYGRNGQALEELSPGGNGDSNGFNTGTRTFVGCGKPGFGQVLYCNPEWDRLMDAAYAERDDAKRRAIFLQANKIFRDDVPMVFLYTADSLLATGPKVRGWKVDMPLSFTFDEVYLIK